jgi:predicted Zn-dependent protease
MLLAAFALAGCESSEERAERHFRSAVALLEAGDFSRAEVEFRNVFRLNGFHREARQTYADALAARGDTAQAYGQYLRLVEQYPDDGPARLALAEIAIDRGDWEEATRHGRAAREALPDDPAARAVSYALDYREAVVARSVTGRDLAGSRMIDLLAEQPDNRIARRIVIDYHLAREDAAAARAEVERALAAEPLSFDYNALMLRLLVEAGDAAGTGAHLRLMVDRFPDRAEVRSALVAWYMSQQDLAGAEGFLRELAGAPTDAPEGHTTVVQFLQQTAGTEAARAELDRLIGAAAGHPNADLFRSLRASLDFDSGRQTEALAEIEDVLRTAAPSDQTRRIKVILARMLVATGNPVGARARVEEVLAEDPSHVEALALRAAWAIEGDRPADAILDLRTALGQAPRDPRLLTLMAEAHDRSGARELAGETLALAVEAANRAPAESLRYARFLLREGRRDAAGTVLEEARRANPADLQVLGALAEFHIGGQDWTRGRDIAAALREIGGAEAAAMAERIEAAILLGQDRTAEGIAFLEGMVAQGGTGTANVIATILQTHLRAGETDQARAYLDARLAERPDDPQLRLLDAGLSAALGDLEGAETRLRDLTAAFPGAEPPVRLLHGLLVRQGRSDEAGAVLDAALAANPTSPVLTLMQAETLLRAEDFEAAIAVYEALYARDSSNAVVANNLASLITTHRTDPESLERGFAIARRLRGMDVPAFQDTYGWIEFRRGNYEEALAHLEPAAAGLPEDPLVQFHLAMTYDALGRRAEAIAQFERTLAIAGDRVLPQFDIARARLAELQAQGEPAQGEGEGDQ